MRTRIASRLLGLGLLCAVSFALPQTARAQGSSMFSGSGLTKSGTGGISGTLGGTGFGSLTSGSSGGLGGALGSATGGRGGAAGGATGFGATGATGMGAANSGFVGRTNTAMAGNSRAGQTTGNTTRQTNRANSGGNNFQSQNQPQANSMTRSSSIRPRQRLGFEVAPRPAEKIVSTVSTRIDKIALKKPALKLVNVELKGDEIVLSGKVKSLNDSKLAENLLRLEPGVRIIRNELEIEQVPVVE